MSEKVRVLLADDSSVIRRMLTQVLGEDPRIEIAFAATNGQEAVDNFARIKPDIVMLDVEMPILDGIETVRAIRQLSPTVPIVMFSSLTVRGGEATLEALAQGANDYVAKPTASGHVNDALNLLRRELIPKLITWGSKPKRTPTREMVSPSAAPIRKAERSASVGRVAIVAVGVSTGGPQALATFLSGLPSTLSVPIVIAQHMPPVFTKLLAERLDAVCPLPVREATEGSLLSDGAVFIAPGDYHMEVVPSGARTQIHLHQGPPENSCRPAVDVLFRSVAKRFANRTLGIVLTGMGKDGMLGSQQIWNGGGRIFAQDEASSTVWGMPRAVIEQGTVDNVVPITQMASAVCSVLSAAPRTAAISC